MIFDFLLWASTQEHTCVIQPSKSYNDRICKDTELRLEDFPGALTSKDGWWESSGILSCQHDLMMMIMLLLLFNSHFFLKSINSLFTKIIDRKKCRDYMYSMLFCLLLSQSGDTFFILIHITLLRRWTVNSSRFIIIIIILISLVFGVSC